TCDAPDYRSQSKDIRCRLGAWQPAERLSPGWKSGPEAVLNACTCCKENRIADLTDKSCRDNGCPEGRHRSQWDQWTKSSAVSADYRKRWPLRAALYQPQSPFPRCWPSSPQSGNPGGVQLHVRPGGHGAP